MAPGSNQSLPQQETVRPHDPQPGALDGTTTPRHQSKILPLESKAGEEEEQGAAASNLRAVYC
jgi:hypothetical protein